MVLISIHPFALRKLFLVIVAFLCFSAFCFADPVLMVRRYSTHPPRLGAAASAPAWEESQESKCAGLANSEIDAPESIDFPREQTKLEFTDREIPSVIRTAASSIFGKPVCTMRPLGLCAGLVATPTMSGPGESAAH